jgi:hypothetical protein
MMKSGIRLCATGENAVVVNAKDADVIVGPIGIVMADSMLGEITPRMALSVARSAAAKVLIPSDRCHHFVAGVEKQPLSRLLEDAVEKVKAIPLRGEMTFSGKADEALETILAILGGAEATITVSWNLLHKEADGGGNG